MTAVDTKVVVRLLTGDPKLAAAAKSHFRRQEVARTVLLEAGWVLRSLSGYEESTIREAFIKLLGLKKVHVEDEPSVAAALAFTAHGIDLADALHLRSRPRATVVSFDRSFVRRAKRASVTGVSVL